MDIVQQHIVDAIVVVWRVSKRLNAESIFKFISTNNTSNFPMSDIEYACNELRHKGKIENRQTKNGWNSCFLVGDQLNIHRRNDQGTAYSEPLKDQGKDVTVDISVDTPKTKDVKNPIKADKIDTFTAQLVAMKTFFMNEVFELKNEIARLKEASLNGGVIFLKKILIHKI